PARCPRPAARAGGAPPAGSRTWYDTAGRCRARRLARAGRSADARRRRVRRRAARGREATMQRRAGAVGSSWIQIFLGGLAIFVIVEQALVRTGNPNYIPTLLVVGAFLVPVTMVAYLYEREPVGD